MDHKDVSKCQSSAVESDWLDITYTQRKYLEEEQEICDYQRKKPKAKLPKNLLVTVGALVIIVGIVCGMIFINGGTDIFETAKMAYISTVFGNSNSADQKRMVTLPVNAVVQGVESDGTVEIGGGTLCMNLTKGSVIAVTETSVTVEIDEDINMVYSNLTSVLVQDGQTVDENTVLGKYDGTVKVNVIIENTVITNIVGTDKSFEWSN
ncbi:MAG TPA: hypothetical protein PK675_01570 [Clostridia bacterium]|nr:hypothetical protein [Clostridia bacterium]